MADFSGSDSSAEGRTLASIGLSPRIWLVPVDPKAVLRAVAKMIELPDDPRPGAPGNEARWRAPVPGHLIEASGAGPDKRLEPIIHCRFQVR